ncbi:hypothetical protein SLA2020_268800 [Shorea laevis]
MLFAGWFHYHKAAPKLAWFQDVESMLNHHLAGCGSFYSRGCSGPVNIAYSTSFSNKTFGSSYPNYETQRDGVARLTRRGIKTFSLEQLDPEGRLPLGRYLEGGPNIFLTPRTLGLGTRYLNF